MFKMYSDGSYSQIKNINLSVSAGYIVDSENNTVLEYGEEVPSDIPNNYHEAYAIFLGLKKAIDLNIKNITCFSDERVLIEILSNNQKYNDETYHFLYDEINVLKNHFEEINFINIPRKENKKADSLCRKTINKILLSKYNYDYESEINKTFVKSKNFPGIYKDTFNDFKKQHNKFYVLNYQNDDFSLDFYERQNGNFILLETITEKSKKFLGKSLSKITEFLEKEKDTYINIVVPNAYVKTFDKYLDENLELTPNNPNYAKYNNFRNILNNNNIKIILNFNPSEDFKKNYINTTDNKNTNHKI